MLKSIRIQNYRNIEDETLELGPLQVLVGKNGVGKSNIVDAFRFMSDALDSTLDNAIRERGGLASIRRWSPRRPYKSFALTITGTSTGQEWQYHIEVGGTAEHHQILRERLRSEEATTLCDAKQADDLDTLFDAQHGEWQVSPPEGAFRLGERALVLPRLTDVWPYSDIYAALTSMRSYAIYPDVLREPQKPGLSDRLEERAGNLCSVLDHMQGSEHRSLPTLKSDLSRIVENVDDVKVDQVGGRLALQFHHPKPKPHWMDASQQSDGTLRVLGILVALHQPADLSLIAIEEPELTLHPGTMGLLCDSVMEAAERMQVLLTTHSPDLISRFPAEYLRVVELRDGLAHVGPVDEAQRQAVEEELFSMGDILRIDGGLRMARS